MGAVAYGTAAVPAIAFREGGREMGPTRAWGIATGNEDKGVHECRMPL